MNKFQIIVLASLLATLFAFDPSLIKGTDKLKIRIFEKEELSL